jgi:hypothetical protein
MASLPLRMGISSQLPCLFETNMKKSNYYIHHSKKSPNFHKYVKYNPPSNLKHIPDSNISLLSYNKATIALIMPKIALR